MMENNVVESRILIVDDNPKNLEVLGKTLENRNHSVEFAVDGPGALEWVENQVFDLILLDVMMPGMNGFEVCKKLRLNPEHDDTPVIFLTAETDKKSIVKGLELGAQDYVIKPFNTEELLARVNTHLELRKSRVKLKTVNKWLQEKVRERTRQLEKANEELLSLDSAKAEFLNIISHEIRTPLNGIIGPMQLLKESTGTGELSELINILDNSVARLERFSLSALTITNLRTQRKEVRKKPVVMKELIDSSLKELDNQIRHKNLQIKRRMIPEDVVIPGEFDLLRMCFINILLNAIRYSEADGEIVVQIKKSKKEISCQISDRGPGFSEEALTNLFGLFAPGEPHIDKNIGLDLALVKMIMDAHEGKVEVMNDRDGGATVNLIFMAGDPGPDE